MEGAGRCCRGNTGFKTALTLTDPRLILPLATKKLERPPSASLRTTPVQPPVQLPVYIVLCTCHTYSVQYAPYGPYHVTHELWSGGLYGVITLVAITTHDRDVSRLRRRAGYLRPPTMYIFPILSFAADDEQRRNRPLTPPRLVEKRDWFSGPVRSCTIGPNSLPEICKSSRP